MVALAGIAAAGIGAVGSMVGGSEAASGQQASAATQQQALQQQEAMAQPFVNVGSIGASGLINLLNTSGGAIDPNLGPLGAPAPTTTADISQMPGYQFTLQQGLLSTQNSAAARGLGVSGAALMGAANYSTGLAQSNYQNYFSDYWANQMNRYNMLAGVAGMGSSAAVGAGSNIGQTSAGIGAAQAGAGNALAAGTSGAGSSVSNTLLFNALNPANTGSTISPSSGAAAAYASELPAGGFLGGSY